MRKILIIVLSTVLFGCGISSNVPEIRTPSTPIDLRSPLMYYGTIKITNFKITNYDTSGPSDKILITYEVQAYSENKQSDKISFHLAYYDKDGFRIGSGFFTAKAANNEKIKVSKNTYIPKETIEIKFEPSK